MAGRIFGEIRPAAPAYFVNKAKLEPIWAPTPKFELMSETGLFSNLGVGVLVGGTLGRFINMITRRSGDASLF